jgi:hypothetical protein
MKIITTILTILFFNLLFEFYISAQLYKPDYLPCKRKGDCYKDTCDNETKFVYECRNLGINVDLFKYIPLKIPKVEEVFLISNKLNGKNWEYLYNLKNLRYLKISTISRFDENTFPDSLCSMNLEYIDFALNNKVYNLSNCTTIKGLRLGLGGAFTKSTLWKINLTNCPNLNELEVYTGYYGYGVDFPIDKINYAISDTLYNLKSLTLPSLLNFDIEKVPNLKSINLPSINSKDLIKLGVLKNPLSIHCTYFIEEVDKKIQDLIHAWNFKGEYDNDSMVCKYRELCKKAILIDYNSIREDLNKIHIKELIIEDNMPLELIAFIGSINKLLWSEPTLGNVGLPFVVDGEEFEALIIKGFNKYADCLKTLVIQMPLWARDSSIARNLFRLNSLDSLIIRSKRISGGHMSAHDFFVDIASLNQVKYFECSLPISGEGFLNDVIPLIFIPTNCEELTVHLGSLGVLGDNNFLYNISLRKNLKKLNLYYTKNSDLTDMFRMTYSGKINSKNPNLKIDWILEQ